MYFSAYNLYVPVLVQVDTQEGSLGAYTTEV